MLFFFSDKDGTQGTMGKQATTQLSFLPFLSFNSKIISSLTLSEIECLWVVEKAQQVN